MHWNQWEMCIYMDWKVCRVATGSNLSGFFLATESFHLGHETPFLISIALNEMTKRTWMEFRCYCTSYHIYLLVGNCSLLLEKKFRSPSNDNFDFHLSAPLCLCTELHLIMQPAYFTNLKPHDMTRQPKMTE